MKASHDRADLARWWKSTSALGDEDYQLLGKLGPGFAARDRKGRPAIVVPMTLPPTGVIGRSAMGHELVGRTSLRFEWEARSWDEAAAILSCTDSALVDAFVVFAADVLARLRSGATWAAIVEAVEEWTELLAPLGPPSTEREMGLWAELWFVAHATDVDRLIAGWRGPDGDATDFFVDGRAVDIKAGITPHQHNVSATQVGAPAGDRPAYLLSVWLKSDPLARWSVAGLVDEIVERTTQPAELLDKVRRAGFSLSERALFGRRYAILSEPQWYPAGLVPRVRSTDPGVSQLRYRIDLSGIPSCAEAEARSLWRHFAGQTYRSS